MPCISRLKSAMVSYQHTLCWHDYTATKAKDFMLCIYSL